MAGNADNILIGAATVSLNGTDVGYTKNGQAVRYKPEFVNVVADQANGVVRKSRSQESMFVKFTLLEVTLENLRIAMMQKTGALTASATVLTIGTNDSCFVDETEIILVGPSSDCGTRTFTFTRCIITDAERVYEMKRDQEVMFEMEFEVLKNSAGEFGTVVDA